MSHFQAAPAPPVGPRSAARAARAVRRPGSLTALVWTSVISVVSAVIGAVLVFAGGNDMADENIRDVIDDHPDVVGLPSNTSAADIKSLSGPIWDELVSDRAGSLAARAGFAIFTAACVLAFTLCVRKNAATWARVLITISGVVALFPHILILGDYEPETVMAFSFVALLATLVAIVLCWLPPTNRYARERKAGPPAWPAS
ncbi:hypothetical protein [Streptomyces lasiicapitis]|uniref:Uncharacterized protein n=1 Tax=Streptomyces lasiicapitis TaxID=1923961 RepID=A0ABQ2MHA2_9ACTN|nr:hypothetical protein [Streptomyces lasiicapitis]GGO51748.1 hypothetical protein GCM10012286_55190 [Streptomyces lasiicapitis]